MNPKKVSQDPLQSVSYHHPGGAAVEAHLNRASMLEQLVLVAQYCCYSIDAPCWELNPFGTGEDLKTLQEDVADAESMPLNRPMKWMHDQSMSKPILYEDYIAMRNGASPGVGAGMCKHEHGPER